MALERTFSIIKPDGVEKNLIGEVYRRFEKAGLRIIAAKMLKLRQDQAEGIYAVHRERPFFADLVKYMTSGPVVVQVLDPDEEMFPFTGTVRLRALEGSGEVETEGETARVEYLAALASLKRRWQERLIGREARLLHATTTDDPARVLRAIIERVR